MLRLHQAVKTRSTFRPCGSHDDQVSSLPLAQLCPFWARHAPWHTTAAMCRFTNRPSWQGSQSFDQSFEGISAAEGGRDGVPLTHLGTAARTCATASGQCLPPSCPVPPQSRFPWPHSLPSPPAPSAACLALRAKLAPPAVRAETSGDKSGKTGGGVGWDLGQVSSRTSASCCVHDSTDPALDA
jgi:hypothetical protein